MSDKKISIIRPKKRVDPQELVEEALEILSCNQKNLLIKVKSGNALTGFEVKAIHDTIRSVAILKDVQLKSIELERRLLDSEKKEAEKLSDKELIEKLKKIADKVEEEKKK